MADYYPLLARALDAMPDRSPALRNAVYERARGALVAQLRTLDPPIPEADIELERSALNAAIARLEADFGTPPVPEDRPAAKRTPDPAPLPPVVPAPPAPVEAPPAPPPFHEEPTPPARPEPAVLPPAPPLELASPELTSPEPAPPRDVVPFAAPSRLPKTEEAAPVSADPAAVARDGTDRPEAASADAAVLGPPEPATENGIGRQRPRLDVVGPRAGRSRLLRNVFVGAVLAVVIGLIAVAAFLLRDKPSDLASGVQDTQDSAGETGDSKFAERVGGERIEPERRPPIPATATAPVVGQGEVTVAQRAHLLEENTADPKAEPVLVPGRAVWRLDVVNGEQGQPLQTVVRATIDVPDANMSLAMTIRKNTDATLPASHTVELAFTTTGAEAAKRSVETIGLLALKDNEQGRGSNVSGLPVRVRENLFLIGLSSLKGDVDRNTDLLLHRPWFDLALKYASGPRAILTFEKGTAGEQVLKSAFDAWRD